MNPLISLVFVVLPALYAAELFTGSFSSQLWAFDEKADFGTRWVRFKVALTLRNTDRMHDHFQDVSNPMSPNYGKFLNANELDQMYGPSAADKQAVRDYFASIPEAKVTMHDHGDLMEVLAPIEHVEKHLDTSLGVVAHVHGRIPQKAIRAKTDISVPSHIADKIAFISLNSPVNHVKPRAAKSLREVENHESAQLTNVNLAPLPKYTQLRVNVSETFPDGSSKNLNASALFALTDVATASFLSDLYQIPSGMQVNHGSNQSCAEFYGEFYSNSDLEAFFALSGLPNNTISTAENYYIDLPNDQSKPGGEAQLDVEYIMALAPNAPTYFYSIGTFNPNDPVNTTSHNEGFLDYLQLVESQEYPPLVHSLSYGDVEADIFNASHNGSVAYGNRCNQEFMQLGLRGLTLVFSSGDDGIGSQIVRDDPETACQQAVPEWPASSPYVTAVGATQLTNKYLPACELTYAYPGLPIQTQLPFQCTGTKETVCSSTFGGVITSGGGFSNVLNRSTTAPWQEKAVDYYLRQANQQAYPPTSYFNPQGRGYPDVATYGSNYFVYLGGAITRESGTSASAPVFAAMVTLWNDIRLANNMPPMGFIAPFLYAIAEKNPEAFHDIVTGNNACGAGHSIETVNCCEHSYGAVPGWDAVTGLGSPNFEIISNLVINNGTAFPNLGAYPTGVAQTLVEQVTTSNDDGIDHPVVRDTSIAAMILGLLAFIMSGVLCFWQFRGKSSSQGLLNNAV
eukprot:gene11452-8148_t